MHISKSQRLRKIIQTNDHTIFYTVVNLSDKDSLVNKHLESMFNSPSSNHYYLRKKKPFEYKIGNYLIQQTLGEGTFGKVKLGLYLPNNEKVAIKVLEKKRIKDKDDKIRVEREFDMLSRFNHPNVILVTEIFESNESFYSVMEYCEGGELFNYIVRKKRLTEKETAFLFFQLINGLEYIHSLGIVHRDLKPENLLLTRDHLLKIIDFGLSNYFKENQTELLSTPCGSPCYASPEMVSGKKYDGVKIDIWATGIILFAMLCGYLPFEDNNNDILFDKILECKIEFPEYLSEECIDLIKKILVVDPDNRITIPGIKEHSFFIKGKQLFDSVYTIKPMVDHSPKNRPPNENENNEESVEINENNMNNENNENIEKNNNIHNNELNENKEIKEKNEFNNKTKKENELPDNKENINNNIKKNKNDTIEKRNKRNNEKNFALINKNYLNKKNTNNGNSEDIKEKQNKNKNSIIKKTKELNNNYLQYTDKKTNNNKKINITDNVPNSLKMNKNKHQKKYNIIPNNKNQIHKIPDNKNLKIKKLKEQSKIKKYSNNLLLNAIGRERNTISIASIGSSVIETINNLSQQTNITNFMFNNINYNVNISFDHSKRTNSHDNTKENEQASKYNINNTIITSNNIISNNNTLRNNNNLISNNGEINNYILGQFNYNNKKNKNASRRNKQNQIKQFLKDPKTTKLYYNSDNINKIRKEMDFNICKLVNDSNINKNYKEYISKKNTKINCTTKNNDSKSKTKSKTKSKSKNKSKNKNEQFYTKKTNHLKILKCLNTNNNEEQKKKNLKKKCQKIQKINNNPKNIISDKNKNLLTVSTNNSKINYTKIKTKSSTLLNKSNITNNKKRIVNKLKYKNIFNQPSQYRESIIVNIQTDPNINIKNNITKAINRSIKNYDDSNINPYLKYSGNNIKRQKQFINSPIKKGKIRQKLIKSNHMNQLFNSSNKKKYKTIHNIITNYKMYKPNLISISTKTNKTEQRIITNPILKNSHTNKNESQIKLMEETSNSIEIRNNKNTYLTKKNKYKYNHRDNRNEKDNISSCSYINKSIHNEVKNFIKSTVRTPEEIKILSKTKNLDDKKLNNETLILLSQRDAFNEKNKLLKMNKFRKICLKNNEEITNLKNNFINKNSYIRTIKRISNTNNNKENLIKKSFISNNTHKNIISYNSTKMNNNKYHFKFNSMKLNDIYKNNARNRHNLQKVYLIKNTNHELGVANNLTLNKKHVISVKDLESSGIINKKNENNIKKNNN